MSTPHTPEPTISTDDAWIRLGHSGVLTCTRCDTALWVKAENGRVPLSQFKGWYFTLETGWLCPKDAP